MPVIHWQHLDAYGWRCEADGNALMQNAQTEEMPER